MGPEGQSSYAGRIRAHRRRTGQSQQDLADKLGVSRLSVINWEKGTWPGRNLIRLNEELTTTEGQPEVVLPSEPAIVAGEPAYQFTLPFEEPIDVLLKIGSKTADSLQIEVRFERKPA